MFGGGGSVRFSQCFWACHKPCIGRACVRRVMSGALGEGGFLHASSPAWKSLIALKLDAACSKAFDCLAGPLQRCVVDGVMLPAASSCQHSTGPPLPLVCPAVSTCVASSRCKSVSHSAVRTPPPFLWTQVVLSCHNCRAQWTSS